VESNNNILDVELIELLLENGIQVTQKGPYGETALHLVSWGGNFAESSLANVAQLLRDNGADVIAKDSCGLIPSEWKAYSIRGLRKQLQTGFHTSLPGQLGFREDAVTSTSWQRHMPLLLAAASGNETLLRIMLHLDNLTTRTKPGVLCTLAAYYGHTSCLKFLLQKPSETQWFKNDILHTVSIDFIVDEAFPDIFLPLPTPWRHIPTSTSAKLYRTNPLYVAIVAGREDCLRLLINFMTNADSIFYADFIFKTTFGYHIYEGRDAFNLSAIERCIALGRGNQSLFSQLPTQVWSAPTTVYCEYEAFSSTKLYRAYEAFRMRKPAKNRPAKFCPFSSILEYRREDGYNLLDLSLQAGNIAAIRASIRTQVPAVCYDLTSNMANYMRYGILALEVSKGNDKSAETFLEHLLHLAPSKVHMWKIQHRFSPSLVSSVPSDILQSFLALGLLINCCQSSQFDDKRWKLIGPHFFRRLRVKGPTLGPLCVLTILRWTSHNIQLLRRVAEALRRVGSYALTWHYAIRKDPWLGPLWRVRMFSPFHF
jgi:ankyrin repeat protein